MQDKNTEAINQKEGAPTSTLQAERGHNDDVCFPTLSTKKSEPTFLNPELVYNILFIYIRCLCPDAVYMCMCRESCCGDITLPGHRNTGSIRTSARA